MGIATPAFPFGNTAVKTQRSKPWTPSEDVWVGAALLLRGGGLSQVQAEAVV